MIDEGYIKFQSHWQPGPAKDSPALTELIAVRNALFSAGLIGIYPEINVGFGNVSRRIGDSEQFWISGTRTGGIAVADHAHFTRVTRAQIPKNTVYNEGPVEASSESMTHAMLYARWPGIGCVVHVHHRGLWEWLPGRVPVSAPEVPYGTPAMAQEVARLFEETDLAGQRIFVMGGHEEGIIAFGADPESAAGVVLDWREAWQMRA
ncbi:MAG: class II aldolase/adducin family protein [Bacteroidota bacterium]